MNGIEKLFNFKGLKEVRNQCIEHDQKLWDKMSETKVIQCKWPEYDPAKTYGSSYIVPIRYFTAKGYHWNENLIFKLESFVLPLNANLIHAYRHWGAPRLEQSKGDMVRLENGKPCDCEDCTLGRPEVEAGWTPWGKDFGFPG